MGYEDRDTGSVPGGKHGKVLRKRRGVVRSDLKFKKNHFGSCWNIDLRIRKEAGSLIRELLQSLGERWCWFRLELQKEKW